MTTWSVLNSLIVSYLSPVHESDLLLVGDVGDIKQGSISWAGYGVSNLQSGAYETRGTHGSNSVSLHQCSHNASVRKNHCVKCGAAIHDARKMLCLRRLTNSPSLCIWGLAADSVVESYEPKKTGGIVEPTNFSNAFLTVANSCATAASQLVGPHRWNLQSSLRLPNTSKLKRIYSKESEIKYTLRVS